MDSQNHVINSSENLKNIDVHISSVGAELEAVKL